MAQNISPAPEGEFTDQEKLMAALSYPIPVVALIVILLSEDLEYRPFQKFHTVQSLAVNIVLWVILVLLSCVLDKVLGAIAHGIGAPCVCLFWLLWLVTLYWAYLTYQGRYFDVPVITDFIRRQGWV
jgi:uncharacterized membrane protein